MSHASGGLDQRCLKPATFYAQGAIEAFGGRSLDSYTAGSDVPKVGSRSRRPKSAAPLTRLRHASTCLLRLVPEMHHSQKCSQLFEQTR